MPVSIIEVQTEDQAQEFLLLPVSLYRNEPCWIRPIDADINNIFNPKKNKCFKHGKCIRWIAKNSEGTVGRIAAFINEKTSIRGNDRPTGGVGFFECIDDQNIAHQLFAQAQAWLTQHGMEAMDGPINFGERDRWWGLLISGFEREPNYQSNYSFPYYQKLFESYGFQPYFYQLTFGRPVNAPVSERTEEKSKTVLSDPHYRFTHSIGVSDLDLAEKIKYVYNKAWASRDEIAEISTETSLHMVSQMKPILDPELLWFGYYKDEPISFFLSVPEVNQIFKHVNGKLNFFGKIKFLYHKHFGANRKILGLLFGVIPEFHGKGVDSAIIEKFRRHHVEKNKYKEIEMNWIADFNGKMIKVCEQIHASVVKRHVTYRKNFDERIEFKRFQAAYVSQKGNA